GPTPGGACANAASGIACLNGAGKELPRSGPDHPSEIRRPYGGVAVGWDRSIVGIRRSTPLKMTVSSFFAYSLDIQTREASDIRSPPAQPILRFPSCGSGSARGTSLVTWLSDRLLRRKTPDWRAWD